MGRRGLGGSAALGAVLLVSTYIMSCSGGKKPADTQQNSPASTTVPGDAGGGDNTNPGDPEPEPLDPFGIEPPDDGGLTNVSYSLESLLENGSLEGACEAYAADPTNHQKKLRCGKWMFFYESFETVGLPQVLVDFFLQNFSNITGPGFENYGMVTDPYSPKGYPLGFAIGGDFAGEPTLAYTCASCHFGQLPDDRYAVGAANLNYEYGAQIIALTLFPILADPVANPDDHHPAALQIVQPYLDELAEDPLLRIQFFSETAPLLFGSFGTGEELPELSWEIEEAYSSWRAGTMDFVMSPLPLEDNVHTISKIIDLWDIPSSQTRQEFGMSEAHLSWTGSVPSLEVFLQGFAVVGGVATSIEAEPLIAYVRTLTAPKDPADYAAALVEQGEQLFTTEGCINCHGGPAGSGITTYAFDEVGTDDALMYWADPELTGEVCCGIPSLAPLTHEVKSPRLTGVWAKTKLLHNGSVDSLEQLLCLDHTRPAITAPIYSDMGHTYGCETLSRAQKQALVAFLKSR